MKPKKEPLTWLSGCVTYSNCRCAHTHTHTHTHTYVLPLFVASLIFLIGACRWWWSIKMIFIFPHRKTESEQDRGTERKCGKWLSYSEKQILKLLWNAGMTVHSSLSQLFMLKKNKCHAEKIGETQSEREHGVYSWCWICVCFVVSKLTTTSRCLAKIKKPLIP